MLAPPSSSTTPFTLRHPHYRSLRRSSPLPMNSPPIQPPTSPYASMSVPFFDKRESAELSSLAHREFESLTSSPSLGLVAKAREADKAYIATAKQNGLDGGLANHKT